MVIDIRRLAETDLIADFDCGDHALNDYLRRHAWVNQSHNLVGVTYVAVAPGSNIVAGYYTLATAGIPRTAIPVTSAENLPRYASLPAALLARLAVGRSFQGSGLGRSLLRHAFENVIDLSRRAGCRYLVVDAYPSAVEWYKKYGFVGLEASSSAKTHSLVIDVRTLKWAVP